MQGNEANGALYRKHWISLTVANFLGLLISIIIIVLLYELIKWFFAISEISFFPFSIIELFMWGSKVGFNNVIFLINTNENVNFLITVYTVTFVFDLLKVGIYSVFLGGLYGSAIDAVFYDKSSISGYFKHIFRNTNAGKMFGLFLCFVLIIFSVFFIISSIIKSMVVVLLFTFIFWFILSLAFMYTPLLVMKEGMGIWKSIKLSFKLLKEKPKKTMKTAFQMLLAYWPTLVPIILSIIFSYASVFGKYDVFAVVFVVTGWVIIFVIFLYLLSIGIAKASLILTNCYKIHMRPVIFPDTDSNKE